MLLESVPERVQVGREVPLLVHLVAVLESLQLLQLANEVGLLIRGRRLAQPSLQTQVLHQELMLAPGNVHLVLSHDLRELVREVALQLRRRPSHCGCIRERAALLRESVTGLFVVITATPTRPLHLNYNSIRAGAPRPFN